MRLTPAFTQRVRKKKRSNGTASLFMMQDTEIYCKGGSEGVERGSVFDSALIRVRRQNLQKSRVPLHYIKTHSVGVGAGRGTNAYEIEDHR